MGRLLEEDMSSGRIFKWTFPACLHSDWYYPVGKEGAKMINC